MGLLDQVIGNAIGGALGGQRGGMGGGFGGGQSPIAMALMALLASGAMGGRGGAGGGLGGMLDGAMGGRGGAMGGGLGGLLEQFQRSGHGDIMDSWVSTGPNRPIQPHQLESALGRDTVDNLSRQTGLGRDDLLSQLSRALPNAVDGLTPHGRLPQEPEMAHW